MSVEFDFSELNSLTADLESASENAGPFIRKAVQVSAHKVRDSARDRVKGRKELGHAAIAIDYDLKGLQVFGSTVLDAEVGYNKTRKAGKLGNLIEFGAPNAPRMMSVKSGAGWKLVPVPGGAKRPLSPGGELQSALHENEADFEHGIQAAIDDALKAVGL